MRNIWSKLFIAVELCILSLLTACDKQDFNPYRHMSTILTIKSENEFVQDKDYILSHVSTDLRDILAASLAGNIYDDDYLMKERNVFLQCDSKVTKIIIEYECTSSFGDYLEVAYFEYEKNILIDYSIIKISPTVDFC